MRNNVLRAAGALALSVFTSACVFESPVPLGPASSAEQVASLVGVYVVLPDDPADEGAAADTVRVREINERELLITFGPGAWTADMRGFITRVKGVSFMNVQELGTEPGDSEPRPFMFARYEWDGDVVEVRMLSGIRESFTSTAALRAWLESRLDDPTIYDEPARMRRLPGGTRG
jgi:hypothetical protein